MNRCLTATATALLASSCVISLGSHANSIRVDGHRLDESHEETLVVAHFGEEAFRVDVALGDIRFSPTEGENRIQVKLWEEEPGDAYAVFEDGRLVSRSHSNRHTGIGDVTVYSRAGFADLELSTGLGDVSVEGIPVANRVTVSTGQGDVKLCCAGTPDKVVLSTGLGDITVGNTRCRRLEVDTGLGDVELDEVFAADAVLSTGLGDVELDSSSFDHVEASTGLGDIDCEDTTYGQGDLSTGLGSVHRD